ncbi:MAG: hypothetical protein VR67_11285 [Peptococcaceae bacterium BRH_c8a]|nr:MAG: hypothetical protein VR67_11285 [Peptococcaceae bacterium BRH_c8a]
MIDTHPWGELLTNKRDEARVCIMGVPFDLAVSCGKGAYQAPEKIRYLSRYLPATTEDGVYLNQVKVFDAGDVQVDLNWERYFKTVEDRAYALLTTGKFCLFLGGDHSVTIPLQKAFGRYNIAERGGKRESGKIGVIHFDAHCDLCNSYDGHHWSHACTERRSLDEVINPGDLTLLGIRSYEKEELDFLRQHPEITVIQARDVYSRGIAALYRDMEAHYRNYEAIYFTLDIDVLDPAFAPGTGTPEAGGLTSRELLELVKLIVANLPVKAMDIVEVSPGMDRSDITCWAALKIIYEVFGCLSGR